MSDVSSRDQTRRRTMRRGALIAAVLVLLALIFLASGHWLLGIIVGVIAAAAVWLLLQLRSVR
jgi:hypothetical protein